MSPKKAIIILIIATSCLVLAGLVFYYIQINKISNLKTENQNQQEAVQKTLTPEEKRKLMSEFLSRPSDKTPEEQAAIKKQIDEFLNN